MSLIAESQTYRIRTPDGAELRLADLSGGNDGHPILVMPGRGQPIEAMHEMIEGFRARGLRVFAADWRGQGGSSREVDTENGHIDDFSVFLRDQAHLIETVFRGEKPLLFGHSMGGHNCLRQSAVNPSLVAGVIATAPMMGIHTQPFPKPVVKALAQTGRVPGMAKRSAPGAKNVFQKDLDVGGPTQSQDFFKWHRTMKVMLADRSLVTGGPTWGWLRAAVASMDAALQPGVPESIQAPALIITAGDDKVVKSDVAESFAARMPNARHVRLEQAWHDIPQETDAIQAPMWREIDRFLDEHGFRGSRRATGRQSAA